MQVKSVTASLLMVSIIGLGALNFMHLSQTPSDERLRNVTQINDYYNENFVGKFEFINLYGAVQKWLGKNEVDNFDVIRDEQGKLHYEYFAEEENDVAEIVSQLEDYRHYLQLIGVDLTFLLTPDKVIEGYTTFSTGLPYNYSNETADYFLSKLDSQNINYLDLRHEIFQSGISPSELFFKTDHHWTPQAAFWAFNRLVPYLNQTFQFELDTSFTNLDLYQTKTYHQFFLGSQGKRTGVIYSGLDDFTVIEPNFETEYTYTWNDSGHIYSSSGEFHGTVLNDYSLDETKSYLERDRYYAYLGGNFGEATIVNHLNQDGIKVLMIKDSYMLPLSAFLSTTVSEIKLVDLRYYEGKNMFELAAEYQPDIVIVSTNPTNLVPEFFMFGGKS